MKNYLIRRRKFCDKLFLIVLLLSFLFKGNVFANNISQNVKVSLNLENASLEKILYELDAQTDFNYIFKKSDVAVYRNLTVKVQNENLKKVLDEIFISTELTYVFQNKIVVIKKRDKQKQDENIIRGIVTNTKGEPIPGVTVIIKGSSVGTSTDNKGNFELPGKSGDTLIVSFIGMKPKEVKYLGKDLKITMQEDTKELKEVVINGYFQKNKESFTGNAIIVNKDDLLKVSSTNLINALQVFDPSFRLKENNKMGSNPNALPDFRIRGNSGFGNEGVIDETNLRGNPNLPTFILDGYEVSVEKIYDLDINRIENITILKDASATAIYGSRAANGVVVVTTKVPEPGQLRVSYNVGLSIVEPDLTDYDLLDAKEKLQLEKDAGIYSGEDRSIGGQQQDEKDYMWRYANVLRGVNTYWLSQPLKSAFAHKHSLYVEGGDKNVRYGLDVNYDSNPGVMKKSSRDRYGLGFTISYNLNNKFLFKNNITINKVESQNSPYGSFSQYALANPYLPIKDENGNYNEFYKENRTLSVYGLLKNPLYEASLNNKDESKYTEITNNFDFDWFISNTFRLKGRLSYSERTDNTYRFTDPESSQYSTLSYDDDEVFNKGYASCDDERSYKLDANIVLTFNKKLGLHYMTGALGGNILNSRFEREGYEVKGFPSGNLDYISFARTFYGSSPRGEEGVSRLAGMFANINYSYNNRYMVDLSYRMDGSSQFGANKRYAPFWSMGLGWNIHNESFFTNSLINRLKLSGNIGQTGKASFSPYQAQTSFKYNSEQWYASGLGATLMAMGNEDLEWEKTNQYDFNMELQLLKGLLSFNASYYIKNTTDLLADISLPLSNGFETYKDNLGELENKGYEITMRAFVIRNKDVTVSLYGSLAHNDNRIKSISNSLESYNNAIDKQQEDASDFVDNDDYRDPDKTDIKKSLISRPIVQFKEGQSTTAIYAVKSLGINPVNGKELFVTRDGKLTYVWNARDKIVCGDTEPDFSGTIGLGADYKKFSLNMNFLYKYGGQVYNQTLIDRVENADLRLNVDRRVLEERWMKPGDVALFKSIYDNNFTKASSRFVMDENVLELNNISLSYTFDKDNIKKWGMERLKLSFLMNDVFRLSSVKMERGIDYPFSRTFNFNIQVQF